MGLHTGESDLGAEREFGVKSLAVSFLFVTCGGYIFWAGMGDTR